MSIELDAQLLAFIEAAKRRGAEDAFVVDLLKAAGWPERRIFAVFSQYYASVTGHPVPVRGSRFEYAGDGFLYVLAFVSLGCWATAAGHLFCVLIDGWFPSGLDQPYVVASLRDRVSLELATIIVAFPIFAMVSIVIRRQLMSRPESADSGVRKWLTYSALALAALVWLGDAIFFLQNFLHGDLRVRFVLDTLVLLSIVGAIFAYYLATLRGAAVSAARDRGFGALSVALVAAAVVCGFTNLGGPARQRAISLDELRVQDLALIESRISAEFATSRRLPTTLPVGIGSRDPLTDASPVRPEFAHAARRTCFVLSADAP